MAYYVIGNDGGRYGPADVTQLNQWAREGRVVPASTLEEEGSGMRLVASQVPGLSFPPGAAQSTLTASPYQQPYPGYVRPGLDRPDGYGGQTEVIIAWILGSIGLLCCPIFFSTGGIILGAVAMSKGHPAGKAAMIFSIVTLVLGIIISVGINLPRITQSGGSPF